MSEIRLGAFRLIRPIAEGGMAVVWGGLHGTELPVAVKVLTGGDAREAHVRAVFRNEVRAVAKLNHPGIIQVLDFGEVTPDAAEASEGRLQEGSPYLVMEYAGGGSLGKRKRRWSWTALRGLLDALLDALAHAHSRGVIHRDLKPGNILLAGPTDLRGGIKLTDFGIAWVGGRDEHSIAGTLQYMAPEQHAADMGNQGPWTDLYGLGCVAWRLAAGHTPFAHHQGRAAARAHTFEKPPPLVPRFPVADGFEAWLRVLLHKDPVARWGCAADARAALAELEAPVDDETEAEDLGDQDEESEVSESSSDRSVPIRRGEGEPVGEEPPPADIAKLPQDWRKNEAVRVPMRLRGAGLGLFALREVPMFGRTKQRELLWKGLRGVDAEGEPRAVLVRGPSGVGKTRLVEWFGRRAYELGGVQTLWVRGDDLASAVAVHLGVDRLEGADRAEHVAERLKRCPNADVLVPALLAGLEPGAQVDAAAWRATVRSMLEWRATERPALLVVDDAHLADEALELAREVALPREDGRRAVLVVLVAREEEGLAERPDLEARIAAVLEVSRAKAIKLGPLEQNARRELLEYLGLGGTLAARVAERSEGNPQFAIQLVGDWVQRGILVAGPDGFGLPEGAEPPIPEGLHEVWSARILRILQPLPAVAGIHLERAAALGPVVSDPEWARACDDPAGGRVSDKGARIRAQLVERLLDARLVEARPHGWAFAHPMLRESLERSSRKAGRWPGHHQALAIMLETADDASREPARIGLHRLEAGDPTAAVDLLFEGYDQGVRRTGAFGASAVLVPLERAMREAGLPGDDLRWAGLWRRLAVLLRQRRKFDEAMEHAERARTLADQPGHDEEWARCTHEIARIQHDTGDLPAALHTLQKAVARLLRANQKGRELASLLTTMSVYGRMMNQLDDAERWASQATGVLARSGAGDPALEGYLVGELAVLAARRKDFDRSLELFAEAIPLLKQGVSPSRLAEVENNRGDALKNLGRWADAEQAFHEAAKAMESMGLTADIPLLNIALCKMHGGRYDEAREVAASVAAQTTKVNAAIANLSVAACDAALGDSAAVDRVLGPSVEQIRNARFVDPDVAWLAEQGAVSSVSGGAYDQATAFWYLAREQYAKLGDEDGVGRATIALKELDDTRPVTLETE